MALYPRATKKLIPPGANDPAITVVGAILHVAAGTSTSLYPYFSGASGGVESHFYVQEKGTTEQYRDTRYEADANLHANSFIQNGKRLGYVSIETWGLEPDEWNAAQLAEIKRLLLWLSDTHDFPLVKCATATSPGVGYHVMFGAPGPWTPVAKSCPGPKRVKQFNNILVPWFKTATTPAKDDDMQFTDPVPGLRNPDGTNVTVGQALNRGVYSYNQVVDGGSVSKGLQKHEFTLYGENGVIDILGTLDQRIKALVANEALDDAEVKAVTESLEDLKAKVAEFGVPKP